MKPFAVKFYKSQRWQDCRLAYFKYQNGICERCGQAGKIVHHKVHLTARNIHDPRITLGFDNLELLCQDCHNKEHAGDMQLGKDKKKKPKRNPRYSIDEEGNKRYDFQFENRRGYKTTIEGLSEKFNKEYWNYAKLISGVLRYRMPLTNVIKLVNQLSLGNENINTWKNGVERALKKYIQDGTEAKGQKCPVCGHESLVYQEGCLICKDCGASRCG